MPGGSVITVGNFDGVHLGHRAILAEARRLAGGHRCQVLALVFDPHPAQLLRPASEPPRLGTLAQRIEALRQAGADQVCPIKVTAPLLGQSPEKFVAGLVRRWGMRAIVEGANFRFGKDRRGNVQTLSQLGRQAGFQVAVVDPVKVVLTSQQVMTVSSTLIRWLLAHGRAFDAARCLGRPYQLAGPVVEGHKRGRALGVPTANLDQNASGELLRPADGVYAGCVQLADDRRFAAAVSIGPKPTFAGTQSVVEAHLIDFDEDLYGQVIRIELIRWLRDQQRFASVAQLKAQLAGDVGATRRLYEQGLLSDGRAQEQRQVVLGGGQAR